MSTIIVRPTKLQAGRSALQRIFVTLSTATWSGSTTFTLSGVSGVTQIAAIVDSPTVAFIAITTTGSATGTLTISDGTNSGTTTRHVDRTDSTAMVSRTESVENGSTST